MFAETFRNLFRLFLPGLGLSEKTREFDRMVELSRLNVYPTPGSLIALLFILTFAKHVFLNETGVVRVAQTRSILSRASLSREKRPINIILHYCERYASP